MILNGYVEENVICYQHNSEKNLPTFRLNAPVVIRAKVKDDKHFRIKEKVTGETSQKMKPDLGVVETE